jgi:hypothetical protein
MSVSFYPTMDNNVAHVVTCSCRSFRTSPFTNRTEAVEYRTAVKSTCTDPYCDYLTVEPAVAEPEVNMSNSNAFDVLVTLGFSADFSESCIGEESADEFLGRILIAEAIAPEYSGLTTMQIDNYIYCGREANYIHNKLNQLKEVVAWAKANQRTISWG